jgi:hypothetical protein
LGIKRLCPEIVSWMNRTVSGGYFGCPCTPEKGVGRDTEVRKREGIAVSYVWM